MLGSLFSYDVNDPGWTYRGTDQQVLNITGRVGAWIADFMLSIIGFMAFTFPLMLMSSAWKFLSEARSEHVDTLVHQLIRWISFIVFRLIGMSYWLYSWTVEYFANKDIYSRNKCMAKPIAFSATVILLLLSCSWFSKITRGLLKALGMLKKETNKQK